MDKPNNEDNNRPVVPLGAPVEEQSDAPLPDGTSNAQMVTEATVAFGALALKTTVLTLLIGVTGWFSYIFGYTIYQSYFQVPEEVEVPAISGKEVAEAYRILESVGLQLQIHESRHEKTVPDRVVISQNPAAGRKVRKNRAILAVVSLGPELIDVPDLKGKTIREAKIVLSNSRLRVGNVTYKDPVYGQPEQILNQRPGPGERVRKGEKINIQVQKGSGSAMIDVPNWKGQHVYDMDRLVADSNLVFSGIVWVFSDYVPQGEVVGQNPDVGNKVTRRTPVELQVSAGPSKGGAFKQRKMHIEVPNGNRSQEVAVILNSEVGASTVFRGQHVGGDEMELLVAGFPGSEIEVYINDQLQSRERL
ncbi:MAG: PASTA domain-containing protein [Candidatus Eremiobacteraeota bacterium]|nr:PASTA domain-containing protein [Candidatus Eremiobacteraeota bacterium]